MVILAAFVLGQSQTQSQTEARFQSNPPYVAANEVAWLPGQLEVVSGLRECPQTIMALNFGMETDPKFMKNAIIGQAYVGYNFGWVRFETTQEDFLGLKVWHVKWAGHTVSHHGKKEYPMDATTEYWVDMDGRIRRQTASRSNMYGHTEAQCDYFPDHIQIQDWEDGKHVEQLLYPAHDELAQLNDQFKPMVVDGKVVVREKPFMVLDPFQRTFEHRNARIGGMFSGKELDTPFHGHMVNIEFAKVKQGACVSDDNDLVRVDLQDGRAIVLTNVPEHRRKDASTTRLHGSG